MPLIRRKSPLHCACVPEVDENLHHLYPRSYLRLPESVCSFSNLVNNLHDFDTNGPSVTVPGILLFRRQVVT